MKQKRKVKSLIPQKKNWSESFLVMILLALSLALCLGSASLMTASVLGASEPLNISRQFTNITYTGLDDKQEALYDMKFVDPSDFSTVVSDIYISGAGLYISPSPVIVNNFNTDGSVNRLNSVTADIYSHILGGKNNRVNSRNITLVAGEGNRIFEGNDNASFLGGVGNKLYVGIVGGVPGVMAGGSGSFMMAANGSSIIGGISNQIGVGVSNGFILGGINSKIYANTNNVIIGGSKVSVPSDIGNVFVYSNFDTVFSPRSSNAFYLNMLKGVGIGMDSDDEGLYVSGVVSVGEIDINHNYCLNSGYGLIGAYNGCIVGCMNSSSYSNWTLLDRSSECSSICDSSTKCYKRSDPVPSHPNYDAFCITGDLDLNLDRVELCYPDLLNYENIVFQADLVDDCDSDNKCMYKCKEGYSREGTGCFSDCTMDWLDADDETFKHNVAFTGYSSGSLSCGILRDDGSDSECGNFGTGLVCYDGTIYLADNGGNYIPGSSVQAQSYNYRSCGLSGFDCDSTYNLDWLAVKFDFPENFNTVSLPEFNIGDILTGIAGGVYELCVDYNVYGGQCRRSGYEFVKLGCNTASGYVQMPDGSCKKNCDNGLSHGQTGVYYASTGVECDGACEKYILKCNNGKLYYSYERYPDVFTPYEAIDDGLNPYPYTGCNLLDKVCDASYNVTHEEFLQWSGTADYVSCTNYSGNDVTNECDMGSIVYKLVNCKPNYVPAGDGKHCIKSTVACGPVGKPVSSEGLIMGAESYLFDNPPAYIDGWYYSPNKSESDLNPCEWSCSSGYQIGSVGGGLGCVMPIDIPKCGEANGKTFTDLSSTDGGLCLDGQVVNFEPESDGWKWRCVSADGLQYSDECKATLYVSPDPFVEPGPCQETCPDDDYELVDGICEYKLKVCMDPDNIDLYGNRQYTYKSCFDEDYEVDPSAYLEYGDFPAELHLCGNGKWGEFCNGGDEVYFDIVQYHGEIPFNLATDECDGAYSVIDRNGGDYDKRNGGYYLRCSRRDVPAEKECSCYGNIPLYATENNDKKPDDENREYTHSYNTGDVCTFDCVSPYYWNGNECASSIDYPKCGEASGHTYSNLFSTSPFLCNNGRARDFVNWPDGWSWYCESEDGLYQSDKCYAYNQSSPSNIYRYCRDISYMKGTPTQSWIFNTSYWENDYYSRVQSVSFKPVFNDSVSGTIILTQKMPYLELKNDGFGNVTSSLSDELWKFERNRRTRTFGLDTATVGSHVIGPNDYGYYRGELISTSPYDPTAGGSACISREDESCFYAGECSDVMAPHCGTGYGLCNDWSHISGFDYSNYSWYCYNSYGSVLCQKECTDDGVCPDYYSYNSVKHTCNLDAKFCGKLAYGATEYLSNACNGKPDVSPPPSLDLNYWFRLIRLHDGDNNLFMCDGDYTDCDDDGLRFNLEPMTLDVNSDYHPSRQCSINTLLTNCNIFNHYNGVNSEHDRGYVINPISSGNFEAICPSVNKFCDFELDPKGLSCSVKETRV